MLALVIPFIICWSKTPTNILNSGFWWFELLGFIGFFGIILVFLAGIPLGIIGIKKAKRMEQLRVATLVLSIINLSAGIIEIIILIMIFCAVALGVTV